MAGAWIGFVGIAVILGIAVLLSANRRAINLRVVGAAFALQAALAAFVLYFEIGKSAILSLSNGVQAVIDYSRAGIDMVFGPLAGDAVGFSFAFNVLPIIIFFSSLMSVLYHIGIMQWLVGLVGGALQKVIGTGPVESMNAAANVFVGQTEAPLVVRPYLRTLTEPQMFAVMTSGVASVAGTVLAAYVLMGAEMKYLLAASFMAAPGGLLMAKILMPDSETLEGERKVKMEPSHHANVILAAAVGAGDGVKLAVNIGAMLVAFVALIALFNGIVGGIAGSFGFEGITLQFLLGKLFAPIAFLIGVPWDEANTAGSLIGQKLVINEFYAYANFVLIKESLSPHAQLIVTFALCGFANLASIAILLGGLGSIIPARRRDIARLGLRAVIGGTLANLMSASLAGIFFSL